MIMYPMSLYESSESNGEISLSMLFDNPGMDIDGISSKITVEELIFSACRGGWPSSLRQRDEKSALFVAEDYLNNICEIDISTIDGVKRNPDIIRAILKSYARNISTLASGKTILRNVSAHHGEISESTLVSYLNALSRLFVINDLSAWCPQIRSATAIRSSKKKEFIDPSIAVAALSLSPEQLHFDLNTFGYIFECLSIRDLRIYASGLGGQVSYYNDRYGLEADCVLRLRDGRYALIEFKLGNRYIEEGAEHLLELKSLIIKANHEKQLNLREPDLLMVITGGEMAYTRNDGVKVVPIGVLRD